MSGRERAITVVVRREGTVADRSYRVPVWALRAGAGAGVLLLLLLGLGIALYGPLLRSAARAPLLQRRVAQLEAENARIGELAAALDSAEARYAQMRQMVGAAIVPEPETPLQVAPAVAARPRRDTTRFERGPSRPSHWPLDESGFVTRGQTGPGTPEEPHPGLDIAVPIGSVVRAAGGGRVVESGTDTDYGTFVLLEHPGGYSTMYGHLSRAVARKGDSVAAGQVIGLSGNSGRSSAPHLHFEIRSNGRSIDPRTMVKEGS